MQETYIQERILEYLDWGCSLFALVDVEKAEPDPREKVVRPWAFSSEVVGEIVTQRDLDRFAEDVRYAMDHCLLALCDKAVVERTPRLALAHALQEFEVDLKQETSVLTNHQSLKDLRKDTQGDDIDILGVVLSDVRSGKASVGKVFGCPLYINDFLPPRSFLVFPARDGLCVKVSTDLRDVRDASNYYQFSVSLWMADLPKLATIARYQSTWREEAEEADEDGPNGDQGFEPVTVTASV